MAESATEKAALALLRACAGERTKSRKEIDGMVKAVLDTDRLYTLIDMADAIMLASILEESEYEDEDDSDPADEDEDEDEEDEDEAEGDDDVVDIRTVRRKAPAAKKTTAKKAPARKK